MKGTEKIIAHIQADAKARADEILAQAEQQAAALREEQEKEAAVLYSEKIRAGVKDCEDSAESLERIARMESRKELLAVKQKSIEECFVLAQSKIVALPDEEYAAYLASLAAAAVVTGEEEIILNARDRRRVGKKLVDLVNARVENGRLTLSDETRDFIGGLILRRGSVETNCTLELQMDLARAEMASRIAGVLFA